MISGVSNKLDPFILFFMYNRSRDLHIWAEILLEKSTKTKKQQSIFKANKISEPSARAMPISSQLFYLTPQQLNWHLSLYEWLVSTTLFNIYFIIIETVKIIYVWYWYIKKVCNFVKSCIHSIPSYQFLSPSLLSCYNWINFTYHIFENINKWN